MAKTPKLNRRSSRPSTKPGSQRYREEFTSPETSLTSKKSKLSRKVKKTTEIPEYPLYSQSCQQSDSDLAANQEECLSEADESHLEQEEKPQEDPKISATSENLPHETTNVTLEKLTEEQMLDNAMPTFNKAQQQQATTSLEEEQGAQRQKKPQTTIVVSDINTDGLQMIETLQLLERAMAEVASTMDYKSLLKCKPLQPNIAKLFNRAYHLHQEHREETMILNANLQTLREDVVSQLGKLINSDQEEKKRPHQNSGSEGKNTDQRPATNTAQSIPQKNFPHHHKSTYSEITQSSSQAQKTQDEENLQREGPRKTLTLRILRRMAATSEKRKRH